VDAPKFLGFSDDAFKDFPVQSFAGC
jgi:hypothetical protein